MDCEDILKKAVQKEIDARDYYASLAQKSINKHSAETLEFLAGQEEKHRSIIQAFLDAAPEERKSVSLAEASLAPNVLQKYTDAIAEIRENVFSHTDETTIMQKAIDFEKSSLDMYTEAAAATQEESAKNLFTALAGAEEEHLALVTALHNKLLALHEEFPETRPDL